MSNPIFVKRAFVLLVAVLVFVSVSMRFFPSPNPRAVVWLAPPSLLVALVAVIGISVYRRPAGAIRRCSMIARTAPQEMTMESPGARATQSCRHRRFGSA